LIKINSIKFQFFTLNFGNHNYIKTFLQKEGFIMPIKELKILHKLWLLVKQGKCIKDSVALGAVGGFLGSVAMALSNYIIYKAGKTEILYGHIAGSIFMRPFKTKRRKNYILGQIFHIVTGSGAGLLMVQIFKTYGTDLALLKGTMVGMFTWQGLYNVGQRLKIYTASPHLTKTGYSSLWNNFVYGVVSSYSIRWLAHPSVFAPDIHNVKQKNSTDLIYNQTYPEQNSANMKEHPLVH
jgi:hypothetical protein